MNLDKTEARLDRMIREAVIIQANLADLYQANGLQIMAVQHEKRKLTELQDRLKERKIMTEVEIKGGDYVWAPKLNRNNEPKLDDHWKQVRVIVVIPPYVKVKDESRTEACYHLDQVSKNEPEE